MSRRLCDRGDVWGLIRGLSARNSPTYGPGTYLGRRPFSGGFPFKRERCLLPCDDFFLSTYFVWKSPYYLKQLSRCGQVLTGILPYHGSNIEEMITDIRAGKRPSRPIDPGQSRWLQDPVWDVITAGWHVQPNQRCELPVMYHTFLPPGQQEVQNFKLGDTNAQNEGNQTIARTSQTPKRQFGKALPQIASFFQFPRDSEPEIQRRVNEMNEVRLDTYLLPRLTRVAAS